MEIGPIVLLPERLQTKVICNIQGGGIAQIDSYELPSEVFWSPTFRPGQLCSLVQEVEMKRTKGFAVCYAKKLLYPVTANEIPGTREVLFETAYSFGIADALEIMNRGGSVRRKRWRQGFDVRWIHDDVRAMIWYNTGDGYLPYLLSQEDCIATDWGVIRGFDKDRHVG